MHRKRNWKVCDAKRGGKNPKKRQTDLTRDAGPGDTSIPKNSSSDNDCQMELAGDTVLLHNSNKYSLRVPVDLQVDLPVDLLVDLPDNMSSYSCNDNLLVQSGSQSDCLCLTDDLQTDSQLCAHNINKASHENIVQFPFNAFFLKFGTFDQFNSRFGDESRGNQCTCNALFFLTMSFKHNDPKLVDPDQVLLLGDEIYTNTVAELVRLGRYSDILLNFSEIPTLIEIPEGKYQICKKELCVGIAVQTDEFQQIPSLEESLSESFRFSNAVLIMMGKICSSIFFFENKYYFFDSHSHGDSGLADPFDNGRSIIIGFDNIDDLMNYLYAQYTSMFINLQEPYEILPVSVLNMDTASVLERQIKGYFEYQQQKNPVPETVINQSDFTRSEKKSRSLYNKLYKQKQRRDPLFRSKEQKKRRESKRKARQDSIFRGTERARELISKRNARVDEDFKNKEADDKRTARQDPDFRNIERKNELKNKQTARKNKEQKDKDAQFKRNARKNSDYVQHESQKNLGRKRESRKNPENLETERLAKQNWRNNNRAKEREYNKTVKQDKRKDTDFTEHESQLRKRNRYGSTLDDCIRKFEQKMSVGPIYICSCCHQTWFSDSVVDSKSIKSSNIPAASTCLTNLRSVNDRVDMSHMF